MIAVVFMKKDLQTIFIINTLLGMVLVSLLWIVSSI